MEKQPLRDLERRVRMSNEETVKRLRLLKHAAVAIPALGHDFQHGYSLVLMPEEYQDALDHAIAALDGAPEERWTH